MLITNAPVPREVWPISLLYSVFDANENVREFIARSGPFSVVLAPLICQLWRKLVQMTQRANEPARYVRSHEL